MIPLLRVPLGAAARALPKQRPTPLLSLTRRTSSRSLVLNVVQRSSRPKLCYPHPARLASSSTIAQQTRLGMFTRAAKFLRDNPYTRFSLVLCSIVLGLSVGFELYMRVKKKKSPIVIVYPPKVGHFTIERPDEVTSLHQKLQSLKRHGKGILCVTGPSGAGKSELVRQYAEFFSEKGRKWRGRGAKPVILYINGSSASLFKSTLSECASNIGIKDIKHSQTERETSSGESAGQARDLEEEVAAIARTVRVTLAEKNLPWLIVVDNLREAAVPCFSATFVDVGSGDGGEVWGWSGGGVIVTSRAESLPRLPEENHVHINHRLSSSDAVKLLTTVCEVKQEEEEEEEEERAGLHRLVDMLHCFPMAVALAASTAKLYGSFLEDTPSESPLMVYADVLSSSVIEPDSLDSVLDTVLSLYVEAAVMDPRMRHTFDLIGSCDPASPLPATIIGRHLSHPFFDLPPPPPPPAAAQFQPGMGMEGGAQNLGSPVVSGGKQSGKADSGSFFSRLKAMLGYGSVGPTPNEVAEMMAKLEDRVTFLRESPLVSFRRYRKSGVELVHFHHTAYRKLPSLFLTLTAPRLDQEHLSKRESEFNRSAWFRSYRTFDPVKTLGAYHLSLPGISAAGVLTQHNFEASPPTLPPTVPLRGSTPSDPPKLTYSQYLHQVSHYHRIAESFMAELKEAGSDIGDVLMRLHLQPHLQACSEFPHMSHTDRLSCSYGLLYSEAVARNCSSDTAYEKFEIIYEEQRKLFGSQSPVLARTLTDMADLKFQTEDVRSARHLLEAAMSIYEKLPHSSRESYAHDIGLALNSLGIVYSQLGEMEKSRDCLEAALALYQVPPPDGQVTSKQRKAVATTLTDVAHAYVSLGQIDVAKKYIELSLMAHRNLYLDPHTEVVRALNVSSIVYALLGDKRESQKQRTAAGKLLELINSQPVTL